MGQQQLLLVLLVVIVVGVSTIVAVNIFGIASNNANRDAVTQDLFAAAANVQAVWEKPGFMSGANKNFENLTDPQILHVMNIPSGSFEPGDNVVINSNGTYSIGEKSDRSISIIGIPTNETTGLELTVSLNDDNIWETELQEVEE